MAGRVKLTMSQSLSPYPALDPIAGHETQSASLAQAEREIKALKEENKTLRGEMEEISSAYKQLITENTHETFDERRVNFLKAQMIQLERQILILNEALSTRESTLLDVENSLAAIANLCRNYTSEKDGRIGQVPVSKEDIIRIMETAESCRIKLYKNIENTSKENTERPVKMLDKFLRYSTHKPPTLLDICSGNLEHLNLKHVAKLESQLSLLYKQLMSINESLKIITSDDSREAGSKSISANHHVPRAVYVRLGTKVARTCNLLKDVTQDLLMLNVLVPSAPWPALKKPLLQDLTTEKVMESLPSVPRSKVTATQKVIDNLIKAINYSNNVTNAQTKALKDELKFHQDIYKQQRIYMEELYLSLRKGYADFQDDTNRLLCKPFQDILRVYQNLTKTSSEDSLKYFLQVFKNNSDQVSEAVERLSDHLQNGEGEVAISTHGEHLFDNLDKICIEHQRLRDNALMEIDSVTHQYELHKEELAKMEQVNKPKVAEETKSKNIPETAEPDPQENMNVDVSVDTSRTSASLQMSDLRTSRLTPEVEGRDVQMSNVNKHKTKRRGSLKKEEVSSTSEGMDRDEAKTGDEATRRPPKPVKGVPQSKLVLNRKTKKKDVDSTSNKQQMPFTIDAFPDDASRRPNTPKTLEALPSRYNPVQHRHEMKHDQASYTQEYLDNSNNKCTHGDSKHFSPVANNDNIPKSRPRSGSLSRLGQRSLTVQQSEPLVSATVHKRFSSGQNMSKPWK